MNIYDLIGYQRLSASYCMYQTQKELARAIVSGMPRSAAQEAHTPLLVSLFSTQRSIDESSPYILLPRELSGIIANNLTDVLRNASDCWGSVDYTDVPALTVQACKLMCYHKLAHMLLAEIRSNDCNTTHAMQVMEWYIDKLLVVISKVRLVLYNKASRLTNHEAWSAMLWLVGSIGSSDVSASLVCAVTAGVYSDIADRYVEISNKVRDAMYAIKDSRDTLRSALSYMPDKLLVLGEYVTAIPRLEDYDTRYAYLVGSGTDSTSSPELMLETEHQTAVVLKAIYDIIKLMEDNV